MKEIIDYIDKYLTQNNLQQVCAIKANEILAKVGILKDSNDRPGKPLRDILRKKQIPHAFQENGRNWMIPKSSNSTKSIISKPQIKIQQLENKQIANQNISELFDNNNFKKADLIDNQVPDKPGIYCIKIINPNNLPVPFREHLMGRNHDIIYIGIASKSLRKRFLNQELRAKGHGTFFRSIGAILSYRPEKGSLIGKANTRNFKFSSKDEIEIIRWINNNLKVNWIEVDNNFDEIETDLILKHLPLINLSKNPKALAELSSLRSECVKIANTI